MMRRQRSLSAIARGRWLRLLLAGVLGAGCSRVPGLRRLAGPSTVAYLDNPRFAFERPSSWATQPVEGGVSLTPPGRRVVLTIAFHAVGEPSYRPPEEFRREMASKGSVEDRRVAAAVQVSGRGGYRARYTTHAYDPERLVGERDQVTVTEVIMLPDPEGIYVITLSGPRSEMLDDGLQRKVRGLTGTLVLGKWRTRETEKGAKPRSPERELLDAAARLLRRTPTHEADVQRVPRRPGLWEKIRGGPPSDTTQARKDVSPALRRVRRLAIVSLVANVRAAGRQSLREVAAAEDWELAGGLRSLLSDSFWNAARRELRSEILPRMRDAVEGQFLRYNPRLSFVPAGELERHQPYFSLDYGQTPHERVRAAFDGSYDRADRWRGVASEGLKYILAPTPDWIRVKAAAGGAERTAELMRALGEYSGLMARLAEEAGADAVITVQHELFYMPKEGLVDSAVSLDRFDRREWAMEVQGLSLNMWSREGRVIWSAKIDKSITPETGVPLGATSGELWAAFQEAYLKHAAYLAVKLRDDLKY